MSIIEETRTYLASQRDKLQQERTRLVDERAKIDQLIGDIDDLFAQLGGLEKRTAPPTARRSGIRDRVLQTLQSSSTAMSPAQIRAATGLTDKAGSQSVSNAISALKKDGKITAADSGGYRAA